VLGQASVRILEGDLDVMVTVGTLYGPPWPSERSTEHVSEDIRRETPSASERVRGRAVGRAELIVVLALLWVRQDVIGALDLLEFFGVTRWFIRVKSKSEFAIGLFDLVFCGALLEP
jgi:hypothetical protein